MSDGDPVARRRYLGLTLLVAGIGALGVVLAASWPCSAEHGGRGGAVGVIIALAAIWMKPSFDLALLDDLRQHEASLWQPGNQSDRLGAEESMDPEGITRWVRALDTAVHVASATEKQAIRWLAGATSVGTVFWGFGDLMALWLREVLAGLELVAATPAGGC